MNRTVYKGRNLNTHSFCQIYKALPIHHSQKVWDIWLSGEIYGKCKKFTLQWYYIMKVGHLSRSMHWWFPHLKQFIETKANNSGGYTTAKHVSVSVTCHVPLSINYSLTTASHAVHKSTYCLLRHGIPLFLKGGPQVIEALGLRASTRRLSWPHRFSMGFRCGESAGHFIWGTPVSSSCSLMIRPRWAGALSSMKMKLGLCCSCKGTMTGLMMLFR